METDDKRKLMICRSCGNTYDYDYFGEENLLKAADKALSNCNFNAANDMYSFMLEKEPSNTHALKGLILASNNVTRLYDITGKIKDGTFIPGTFNLKKYRDKCDPDGMGFFDKADKVLSLYKEYIDLKKNGKALVNKVNSLDQKHDEYGGGMFYYESDESLKKTVIIASIILVILGIVTLIFSINDPAPSWLICILIIAIIVTCGVILSAILRMRGNAKKIEETEESETDAMVAKIDDTKNEMYRVIKEINAVFKEMNSY